MSKFINLDNLSYFWTKVKKYIEDINIVVSSSLNDLNSRLSDIEEIDQDAYIDADTKVLSDANTYTDDIYNELDTRLNDTNTTIEENAQTTSAALNDLNTKVSNIKTEYTLADENILTAALAYMDQELGNLNITDPNSHTHDNKDLLDTYTQTEANLADAVSKKHTHTNKTVLDGITSTKVSNWDSASSDSHTHSNKALLDTYTQTEANLADAVSKKHTHINQSELDKIEDGWVENTIGITEKPLSNRITDLENSIIPDARAKVLWLGTSIPVGDINIDPEQNNTYPRMVADALGFDLYNQAKAGSFVAWYPQAPNWTTSSQVAAEFATAYCLSATRQEIYDKYYNVLETIRINEGLSTTWRDDYLNDFMDSSFETRIIPYIDGTIAKCDGVVIDHGFNDRGNIFGVCGQHADSTKDNISYWPADQVGGATVEYPVTGGNAGWWWLTHLADDRYYDGFVYMNTVYAVANGLAGDNAGGMRGEYFGAMAYIIAKIQQVDPRIRIIIGNYFSQDYGSALGDGMNSFQTKYILQANQSIADYYGFPCVNVYKHTGLRNRTIRKPDGSTISDMYWFCPDGVHPASDTTGLSNSIVASAYISQIKGVFFSLV